MKRMNWITLFLSVILTVTLIPSPISAYERDGHDKCMNDVLFYHFKEDPEHDPKTKNELKVLSSACYLAIDQFNNNGQHDLDALHAYGVKDIPASVGEFSFNASGKNHRSKTHRGWDFPYGGDDNKLWQTRKHLLLNTAEAMFDFNENEKQKDSFCALLYYVHILGDHMDDDSFLTSNGLKMDVGGRIDEQDVIHEVLKHLETLFPDQTHTHKYHSLTHSLLKYDRKLSKIVRSSGGINTSIKFEEKQEYTKKVYEALTLYIPEMLKEEAFFNQVFYQK